MKIIYHLNWGLIFKKMKTVGFYTFGCKLNFSETSSISREFTDNGYKKKSIYDNPNKVIINTCSVTENADKKCQDLIRKIKKKSPDSEITVVGCFAQLKPNDIINIKGVDKVIGAKNKFNFQSYISDKSVIHSKINESKDFKSTFSIDDRTRSFLKIQDGCNYGCSFCTIPLARGRSRSAKPEEVLSNLKELIKKGSKEIVLSGINIGDYGIIEGKRSNDFYTLLQKINNEIKNIRIRISSIEPNLLSNEIIKLIGESEIFVNHFHIPLQSGSNKILNGMSRRYTSELYEDRVKYIKKLMPDACVGGDVIVGFPGEDKNEFDITLEFIKNLDMSYLHVFPYSERANTRAISLNESVPIEERNKRSKVLRLLSDKKKRYFYESNLNNVRNVLFENKVNGDFIYGFTDNYVKTKIKFNKKLVGKECNVLLKKVDDDLSVIGEIV